jgi:uncharacterized paraquat-inducible protein A
MGWSYETNCTNCGARLKIVERPMGVPGGKDKEQAYCPKCRELVAEHMTDGFINAYLIEAGAANGASDT